MRVSLVSAAILVAGAVACGGKEPTGGGTSPDVAGTWTYFETVSDAADGLSCNDQGTFDVAQAGAGFSATATQTGYCTGPGGVVDNSGTGSVSGFTSATTIQFDLAGCRYRGSLFATPPDSAAGSVSCSLTENNKTFTLTGTWFAVKGVDLAPPTAAGTVTPPQGDVLFVPSDTFLVTVTAGDDRRVLWAGYRLGPPASMEDSVEALQRDFTGPFRVIVPPSWVGTSSLTVFARDALGRTTEAAAGTVQVLDAIRRPFKTVALGAATTGLAYDVKRDAVYLPQPQNAQLAVLSLGSFTLQAPLSLPGAPTFEQHTGIDMVPGWDSVVVSRGYLVGNPSLGVVNLVSGTDDSIRINGTEGVGDLQVVSTRKVFVFGQSTPSGGYVTFGIWEDDLVTGTQQRRTDVGLGGNVGVQAEMARSGDQTKLLAWDPNTACAQIYDVQSDAFSACKTLYFPLPAVPAGTASGDRWLVHNLLFDGALNLLATVLPSDPGPGTIAPDGSAAYYPTLYGYEKVRLPDGVVLERVRIPPNDARLTVLPDGLRLVLSGAGGFTRVTVVDLR